MWKRVAFLVVVALLPVSAVAHTKLFYRNSYRSDYQKIEVLTPEPTVTLEPTTTLLVEILLESTLTPEPPFTPMPAETATELPTLMPEDVDASDQITTPTDISATPKDFL